MIFRKQCGSINFHAILKKKNLNKVDPSGRLSEHHLGCKRAKWAQSCEGKERPPSYYFKPKIRNWFYHSIYTVRERSDKTLLTAEPQYIFRTVCSQRLFSALLNWFKLIYGPFGTVHFISAQTRPGRKESIVPKIKSI